MNFKLTPAFQREIKKISKKSYSIGNILRNLKETLETNPSHGVSLGGGFFKIRIQSDFGGKSGGYRMITYYKNGDSIFFVYIYPKSRIENVSLSFLKSLIKNT